MLSYIWGDVVTTGEKIRLIRTEQGLTQKQLGVMAGIAEPTIRRYELGKLNPKLDTLDKIADALGVGALVLLPDDDRDRFIETAEIIRAEITSEFKDILDPVSNLDYDGQQRAIQCLNALTTLNSVGQEKAVDQITELTKMPQFQKSRIDGDITTHSDSGLRIAAHAKGSKVAGQQSGKKQT